MSGFAGFGLEAARLLADAQVWDDASDTMSNVSSNLGRAYVTALPPSVAPAASAFLQAWAGYADESAQIATGLAEGLREIAADADRTDSSAADDLGRLDSRLGPER